MPRFSLNFNDQKMKTKYSKDIQYMRLIQLQLTRGVLLVLLSALCLPACKKFVQIPPPVNTVVTSTVFSNNDLATSAQTAIYQQMVTQTTSINTAQFSGFFGDELTHYLSKLAQG